MEVGHSMCELVCRNMNAPESRDVRLGWLSLMKDPDLVEAMKNETKF